MFEQLANLFYAVDFGGWGLGIFFVFNALFLFLSLSKISPGWVLFATTLSQLILLSAGAIKDSRMQVFIVILTLLSALVFWGEMKEE